MQYSVWVIPPEPIYSQLKNVIEQLAKEYGGPLFEPHLTIIGPIENDLSDTQEKVKNLAKDLEKLELTLGPVSFSTTYFQSVFVRVNSTAKLMQLNLNAKKLFHLDNSVFMPHISLLYGNHNMKTREEAALKINLPESKFFISEFIINQSNPNPNKWKNACYVSFDLST